MKILIHFVSTTGKEGAHFYKETMSIFRYFLTCRSFILNFYFSSGQFLHWKHRLVNLFSPSVSQELRVPWFEDKLQSFRLFCQFSYFLLNEPNEISKKQGLRNYTTNAFFFFCLPFFLFLTRSDNWGVKRGKFSVTGHICYIVGPQTLNHEKNLKHHLVLCL